MYIRVIYRLNIRIFTVFDLLRAPHFNAKDLVRKTELKLKKR